MREQTTTSPLISFSELVRARKPQALFEERLLTLLRFRLKQLKIVWNPRAFRGGLNNPKMPASLLEKLESLIVLAESVNWKLSKAVRDELDAIIEDIESFNPVFQESLRRASADVRAGRVVTQEELEKRYGLVK